MLTPTQNRDMTTTARRRFDILKRTVLQIDVAAMAGGKLRPLYNDYAADLGKIGYVISAERLRKRYEKWRASGREDETLIDLRLCGGKLGRKIKPASALPESVIQLYHAQRQRMADKDPCRASWRWIITRLITGEPIAGVGTWQTLFMRLNPAEELPPSCPWNYHNPPPGWSLSNFRKLPGPTAVADALATDGVGAAKALLAKTAGVRIDWQTLRPMELVWFDDHDLDFGCIVSGQIVRLRLIMARDARTRRILSYGVRPRLKDEEGRRQSITRRDMQHLVAGLLFTFGLPKDYPILLLVENAAATIAREFHPVLDRVTQGRVKVDYTGLYNQAVRIGGYAEKGGSPTGKANHESGFKLFDIELAHVRGQFGSNYTVKPDEVDPRMRATQNLLKDPNIAALVDSQNTALRLPFPDLFEAHREVHLALQRIDHRTWHEMEGFLTIHEFRFSKSDPQFRPLHSAHFQFLSADLKEDIKSFLEAPENLQNRWLSYGRKRSESAAECWQRLTSQTPFLGLSKNALGELLLDVSKPQIYAGTNTIRLEIDGKKHEFRGLEHDLQPGQSFIARYNQDNPQSIYLQDCAGRQLGWMDRSDRLHYHDVEGRRAAMEFQAIELHHAMHEVRTMQMAHPDALAELRDQQGLHLLGNVNGIPVPVDTLESPSSDELVNAISRKPRKAPETDAEAYAKMQALMAQTDH